jgi:beta-galactosidase
VKTEVVNALDTAGGIKLLSEVLSPDGQVVATGEAEKQAASKETLHFEQADLMVEKPLLWSPAHPHLYTLRSRVYRDGMLRDEVENKFGIRVMGYVPGKGYTINGEYIRLQGVNRRQDYGYLGDALPDAVSRRDMEIIKELGANFVRTAHYIQDKSILEAADELGILIWEEIPNIKIYDYSPTASTNNDCRYTRKYLANCLQAMEEMIRDHNHPSILIWGIGDDLTGYPYLDDLRELNDMTGHTNSIRPAGRPVAYFQ